MEKIGDERGGQTQAMKSQVAIRCAKAAILLSSLKNSPNNSSNIALKNEEEIEELKRALVKEKLKNKKLRTCVEMELLVFVLWTFFCWSSFEIIVAFTSGTSYVICMLF